MNFVSIMFMTLLVLHLGQGLDPNFTYEQFCQWTEDCPENEEEYEAHRQIFMENYAKLL